ncbi:hypothetical protein [Streptomyces sp. NPDC002403]
MDPDVGDLDQGDLLMEGSLISAVGPRIEAAHVDEEIDATGLLWRQSVSPWNGLVETESQDALSGAPSCGVCRHPRTGREGLLTCGFAHACFV